MNINNHNDYLDQLYDDKCFELKNTTKQMRIANNKLDFERIELQ